MPKRLKFKPELRRVKLNPEQAILACPCFNAGYVGTASGGQYFVRGCVPSSKIVAINHTWCNASQAAS